MQECEQCNGEGGFSYWCDDGFVEYACPSCNGTGVDPNSEPDNSFAIELQERSWDSYMYGE
jgi:DnaJ-class molecular chaperone